MDKYQNWHTLHRSTRSFKSLSLSLRLFFLSRLSFPDDKAKKGDRVKIIGQLVKSSVKKK